MINEKGLSEESANKIGEFVRLNGSSDLIDQLLGGQLGNNANSKEGLLALKLLFQYCQIYKLNDVVSFDLSLARGLDYYTGLIYEVVLKDDGIECGSIAAGGRYDTLVSLLADNPKFQVPCVGISLGIERLLTIIEHKYANEIKPCSTQVLVMSIGTNLTEQRMKILVQLWENGINAEHFYKNKTKLLSQIQYCEEYKIPYAIVFGNDEIERGTVKIRNIQTREEVSCFFPGLLFFAHPFPLFFLLDRSSIRRCSQRTEETIGLMFMIVFC